MNAHIVIAIENQEVQKLEDGAKNEDNNSEEPIDENSENHNSKEPVDEDSENHNSKEPVDEDSENHNSKEPVDEDSESENIEPLFEDSQYDPIPEGPIKEESIDPYNLPHWQTQIPDEYVPQGWIQIPVYDEETGEILYWTLYKIILRDDEVIVLDLSSTTLSYEQIEAGIDFDIAEDGNDIGFVIGSPNGNDRHFNIVDNSGISYSSKGLKVEADNVTLTIENINLHEVSKEIWPFHIKGGITTLLIPDNTKTTIQSISDFHSSILVDETATLIIDKPAGDIGSGKLEILSSTDSKVAAISTAAGNLIIKNCEITAVNYGQGAGIGSGNANDIHPAGNITIEGGTIYSTSEKGAAIGGGSSLIPNVGNGGDGPNFEMTGGKVYAKSIDGVAIGGGNSETGNAGNAGQVKITGGFLYAESTNNAGIGAGIGNHTDTIDEILSIGKDSSVFVFSSNKPAILSSNEFNSGGAFLINATLNRTTEDFSKIIAINSADNREYVEISVPDSNSRYFAFSTSESLKYLLFAGSEEDYMKTRIVREDDSREIESTTRIMETIGENASTLPVKLVDNIVTINYHSNNGESDTTISKNYIWNTGEFLDNEFSKPNHIFNSWNTSPEGAGTIYGKNEPITFNFDELNFDSNFDLNLDLYAQWSPVLYTVRYEIEVGSDEKIGAQEETLPNPLELSVEYGSLLEEPNPEPKPYSPEKYKFSGWAKTQDGSEFWNFKEDTVTEDIVLYAIWSIEKTYSYRVQYYINPNPNIKFEINPSFIIHTTIGTEMFEEGFQLQFNDVEKDLGNNWINVHRPVGYTFGEVLGGYPIITNNIDKNIVHIVYTKIQANETNNSNSGSSSNNNGSSNLSVEINENKDFINIIEEEFEGNKYIEDMLRNNQSLPYAFGYPDGSFGPDNHITRAEAAMMIYRLFPEDMKTRNINNGFSDVDSNAWYSEAVNFLANRGIIEGYPNNSFQASNFITRAEFSAIIARYKEIENHIVNTFIDLDETHWASGYIGGMYNRGLLLGYPDNSFKPNNFITRATTVTLINRVENRKLDELPAGSESMFTDVTRQHWAFDDIIISSIVINE